MARTAYKKDERLLQEALDNFKVAVQQTQDFNKQAIEDLSFLAGNQRPAQSDLFFQVNLLNPFLRQITADAREANPAIEVVPLSGNDQHIASIFEGLIRSIEEKCDASTAYQTALWYAAACGVGYILLDTEYVSPESFDQEYVIKSCDNPFKVFLDPTHELLDGCDAEWGFIIEDLGHEEFKRAFPKSETAKKLGSNQGWKLLQLPHDWLNEKAVRVARYYVKRYDERTIYLYEDPLTFETVTLDVPPDEVIGTPENPGTYKDGIYSSWRFVKKRRSNDITVKAYALTAYEVLDETVWPGKYLPIVKVTGDTYTVGGKKVTHGAIRFAKDPQRQFNFHLTKKTELIDLIPKVPFVAANGQVVDNPELWANAHRVPVGTLTYKPMSLEGQMVPPPTRPPGIDGGSFSAIAQGQAEALEHLKLVFGMHGNPMLDQQNNDTSGVALDIRQTAASRSQYIYFDHLLSALRCLGRQLIDGIPIVMDTDRMARIIRPDGEEQVVAINSISNKKRYDLTKGTYDVRVKTGPAYATRREKSLQTATQVLPLLPENQRAVVTDQVLRLVDDPIAGKMADRIKATLPPEVLAATGDGDQEDLAPMEMVQQLQQQLSSAQQLLKLKDMENQELQVKVKVAEDKTALELTKADMENEREVANLQHESQVAEIEARLKLKELELAERKLALEEQKLEIAKAQAASGILDTMKPDIGSINIPGNTTDIGGKL